MKIMVDDYINKHIPLIIIPYNDYKIINENYLKNKIMEACAL